MRLGPSSVALASLLLVCACGVNLPDANSLHPDSGPGVDAGPPPPPTIVTQSLPPALEGEDYGAALGANGGQKPLTWSITQLPPELSWLALRPDSGVLEGPAPRQPASGTFQVQVVDALSRTDSVSLSLAVQACRDGDVQSCLGESGAICLQGSRVCANGVFGPCSAPDAGTPSVDAEHCGPDCNDCGVQGGDRCDNGSCVCGDGGACAPGSTCCGDGCSDLQQANHCHDCGNDCAQGQPANTVATCGSADCEYACAYGYGNCAGLLARDAGDGCETDLLNTVTACGACGYDCGQHLTTEVSDAGCGGGSCEVTGCFSPFGDCDQKWGNGCETNLANDVTSCGACGNNCDAQLTPNVADAGCGSGSCEVGTCNSPFGDCDTRWDDGCETNLTDTETSCGACGYDCDAHLTQHVADAGCGGSTCHVATCQTNYGDCDNSWDSGCETNLSNTVTSCGACGYDCGAHLTPHVADAGCGNSSCQITACTSPYADCDNSWDGGCETNLHTDPNHCGTCGVVCPGPTGGNGQAVCNTGTCGISCNTGYSVCGNTCKNLKTDSNNCGTCGNVCPGPTNGNGTAICTNGSCGISCNSAQGYSLCGTECVKLGSDPANCNTCGNVCPGPTAGSGQAVCNSGTCGISCDSASGYSLCGTECVKLSSDANNCGSCGNECDLKGHVAPGGASCQSGQCNVNSCESPYADCNGIGSDGCEVDLTSDVKNCGACNNQCTGNLPSCQPGLDAGSAECCTMGACPGPACGVEACSPAP